MGIYWELRERIFLTRNFYFHIEQLKTQKLNRKLKKLKMMSLDIVPGKIPKWDLTVGGSALSIWFVYKGLNVWEKWMKDQEQKDIEEEIEMTGTYINPGAGNVETSIDPITGKKIEIKPSQDTDNDSKKSK